MLNGTDLDALRKMVISEGIEFDVEKDIISTQTVHYDGQLPETAVTELIDLTMSQDSWLKEIPWSIEDGSKGMMLVHNWSKPAAYPKNPGGSGENIREPKPINPDSWKVPYACEAYKSDLIITRKELREARRMGITNFNEIMREGYAKALNNTIADLAWNADKSLPGLDDWEKSRQGVDGWLIELANSVIYDANGAEFAKDVFPMMIDMIDDKWANDSGLRWFANRRVFDHWKKAIGGVVSTASFQGLSAEAITQRLIAWPEGIDGTICPQLSSREGPSADADNVADATGKVKVRCDTAFRGYAAAKAGRRVRVTHKLTGISEIGYVADDSSHLEFTSAGLFGNATADTTASNYTVKVHDETNIILTNPNNLRVVFDGEWRAYPDFDIDAENFRVVNHFDVDFVVVTAEAAVRVKEMHLPRITI